MGWGELESGRKVGYLKALSAMWGRDENGGSEHHMSQSSVINSSTHTPTLQCFYFWGSEIV